MVHTAVSEGRARADACVQRLGPSQQRAGMHGCRQAGESRLGSLAGCCTLESVCCVRVLGASAGMHVDVARCAGDKHVRRVGVAF